MAFALIPICLQVGGSEVILLMFSDRFAVKLTEQKYARRPLGTVVQSSKNEDNSTGTHSDWLVGQPADYRIFLSER